MSTKNTEVGAEADNQWRQRIGPEAQEGTGSRAFGPQWCSEMTDSRVSDSPVHVTCSLLSHGISREKHVRPRLTPTEEFREGLWAGQSFLLASGRQ